MRDSGKGSGRPGRSSGKQGKPKTKKQKILHDSRSITLFWISCPSSAVEQLPSSGQNP